MTEWFFVEPKMVLLWHRREEPFEAPLFLRVYFEAWGPQSCCTAVSCRTNYSMSFSRNNYTCNMMLTYFRPLHVDAKAMWFSLPFERSPHLRWLAPPWQLRRRMGHFRKSVTSGITYAGVLTKSAIHINTFFHMALGGKMSVQFRQGAGHFPVHLQQVTSVEKSMHYYFLKVYVVL